LSVYFRYITVWTSGYGQDIAGEGRSYRVFIEFSEVHSHVLLELVISV